MKLKIWISYCLLASFFVLLTPRSLWHDCDNHQHQFSSSDDHSKQLPQLKNKKCFACEFDLGTIDLPSSILAIEINKTFSCDVLVTDFRVSKNEFPFFLLRGPPIV